jgi:hypothetical protein
MGISCGQFGFNLATNFPTPQVIDTWHFKKMKNEIIVYWFIKNAYYHLEKESGEVQLLRHSHVWSDLTPTQQIENTTTK